MPGAPWPSWIKTDPQSSAASGDDGSHITNLKAQFSALPPGVAALTAFALGSATAMSAVMVYKRYGRRIRSSGWITPNQLTRKRWLRGVATSVGDADNFRFFHTPPLGSYTWPLKLRPIPSLSKDLKDETIHIRIAGIDAPEAAHFGKPAQPYAAESLEWLRNQVLGKTVYCQVLRKDQYSRIVSLLDQGRQSAPYEVNWRWISQNVMSGSASQTINTHIVVAQVYLAPRILPGFLFHGKNVSAEMLKAGWAVTYEQAGAEYGNLGKDGFLRLEAEAKAARRGMWQSGKSLETPSQYKRRHAAAVTLEEAEAAKPHSRGLAPKKTWLRSLFTRS